MRSLMGDKSMVTNINRPNEGQISYLPKGRIVESNGLISEDSIRPIVATDPPLAIQNLVRQVSDVQEMTLEAIYNGDDNLLFTAFLSDPLMNLSLDKARELFDKMLASSALQY
jgi:alpha-galactosidase